GLRHLGANLGQVLGQRFWRMKEVAVGPAGAADRSRLECLQQLLAQRSARPTVGVDEGAELARTNAYHIHQLLAALTVPGVGVRSLREAAELVPGDARELVGLEHLLDDPTLGSGQHRAAAVEELQAVPRGRIMTSSDLDAAHGLQMPDGDADRRRRGD